MSYTKTNWQNGLTDLNETNMNKIENELEAVDKSLKFNSGVPSDWNDARTFGIYSVGGVAYTNAPVNDPYGILIVYENNGSTWQPNVSSWIWQEFRQTNGDIYKRHAVNELDSWSEWKPYYSDTVEVLERTVNSSVITDNPLGVSALKIGKLVIVNFWCQFSTLSQPWGDYLALTLPSNITAKAQASGVLSCQNPNNLPITVYINLNSNEIKVNPFGNTLTGSEWYRGQLVFIAN